MEKKQVFIFVVADEAFNAGERDYLKALTSHIAYCGLRDGVDYLFYKIPAPDGKITSVAGDARAIPISDKAYAAIPRMNDSVLKYTKDATFVRVIGTGNSTLTAVKDLQTKLLTQGKRVEASWITHMPTTETLKTAAENNILMFAPTTREKMREMDAEAEKKLLFLPLDAVPHTNTAPSCKIDCANFLQSANGKQLEELIADGSAFAFVVLNAGFEVGPDKIYTPYTEDEARKQGAALGKFLPPGTHLVLAHGGPRNLRDEIPNTDKKDTHAGQQTMDIFAAAYEGAQREKDGQAVVIKERFAQKLPYNVIKAGYILARRDNCIAFISNSEGYGTMDAATLHINNERMILAMFPFQALYQDETGQRQANIENYNKKGVAVITVENGEPVFKRHPDEQETPSLTKDPTGHIAAMLSLADIPEKPAGKKKRRPGY